MTAKELITRLSALENLDIEIVVYADHGQSTMKANGCGITHVDIDDAKNWTMDTVHEDDMYEDVEYVDFFEISAC